MMICARGSFTASSDHAHCTYTCGKCGKMIMMHRGHLSCVGGSCRGHWSHDHHVTCHVLSRHPCGSSSLEEVFGRNLSSGIIRGRVHREGVTCVSFVSVYSCIL